MSLKPTVWLILVYKLRFSIYSSCVATSLFWTITWIQIVKILWGYVIGKKITYQTSWVGILRNNVPNIFFKTEPCIKNGPNIISDLWDITSWITKRGITLIHGHTFFFVERLKFLNSINIFFSKRKHKINTLSTYIQYRICQKLQF